MPPEFRNAVAGDPPVPVMTAHRWSDGEFMSAVTVRCRNCGADVLKLVRPGSRTRFGDLLRDPCPICEVKS